MDKTQDTSDAMKQTIVKGAELHDRLVEKFQNRTKATLPSPKNAVERLLHNARYARSVRDNPQTAEFLTGPQADTIEVADEIERLRAIEHRVRDRKQMFGQIAGEHDDDEAGGLACELAYCLTGEEPYV